MSSRVLVSATFTLAMLGPNILLTPS